jgi:hypothetical protein
MRRSGLFRRKNGYVLLSMLLGIVMGYIYWVNWGIYYATLPLSSECWVNCVYGGLFTGLAASLIKR